MNDQITIHAFDDTWRSRYQAESEKLLSAFGSEAVDLAHFGSTAVPELSAKSTIDILIGIRAPIDKKSISIVQNMDYSFIRYNEPWWAYFRKGPDRAFHLHMIELSTPEGQEHWRRHLYFRDALRASQDLRRTYQDLKFALARKFADDRRAYEVGKTDFVLQVLKSMPTN